MAIHVNKAIIVGRLGADPEAKGQHGDIVNLRVATSESWKDKNGERQERTQWHTVVIFTEQAGNFVKQYAKKGDLVYIEGTIETRKWERGPNDNVYFTEIVIRPYSGSVQLQRQGSTEREPEPERQEERPKPQQRREQTSRDLDDEIPF